MFEEHSGGHVGTATNRYRHLIEHVQDAIVEFELVDGEPIIRTVNYAFEETFGHSRDQATGESLNELIVPEWDLEEARRFDQQTSNGEINYQRVRRETVDGLREFLYRSVPYEADTGQTSGFAVYTDLTDISRNERRLAVMNRVLRHNLRNKTNLIGGHTARLLQSVDEQRPERAESAAVIEAAVTDLEQLAAEASTIHDILRNPDIGESTVDCVPLIRQVVDTHRRRSPNADIVTDLPESMRVRGTGQLESAVDSLVENAVEHNPADAPRVRVRVDEADATGWARILVDDDGPRIPASEREVITGQTEITQLCHGSGLGLWLVNWTVQLFGGELAFARSDLGGNRVEIRLPMRPDG